MRGPTRPHLLWVFPGFGVGGAQVRFAALANHWGQACRHSIVALNGDTACAEKLAGTVDVDFLQAGARHTSLPHAAWHARGVLAAAKPDCVITSNWGAIEWAIGARLAGLRHVHAEDGFGPEERARQLPRRVFTRRLALRGSAVVLPSLTLQRIARTQWRLPASRLHYIPNGIDLARFARVPPREPRQEAGPVIGTIAALRAEKNIARLIAAFAQLGPDHPARLVIVGDGPQRGALETLAATLGVAARTHFAGHSTEPEAWLAGFDVFALSSDTEQMPLSLLEAMAASLPAVCTDVGDVAAMVSAANAAFIAAADDAAFASALAALLADDGAAIGRANRAKAEAEFGQPRMFAAWGRLLQIG